MSTLHYRMRVRTSDDSADLFSVSSVPTDECPYIASEPDGDGTALDPITGQVTVGAYTLQVIDALHTDTTPSGTLVTEGWEYANLAAAQAANWSFNTTMSGGTITVGATDQFYSGSRSLKYVTTGTGTLAGTGVLRATKIYSAADGIQPNGRYQVTIRARTTARGWFDVQTRLIVNGVTDALQIIGIWELLTVQATADAAGNLTVSLERKHSFVTADRTIWWDELVIESLTPAAPTTGRIITQYLTDADARQQLLSKKAYLEVSGDEGETWLEMLGGYVNRVALANANKYEFTIGESKRVEQSRKAFARIPTADEYARYEATTGSTAMGVLDRASCLIGGPIVGHWGPMIDRGRPVFVVDDVQSGYVRLKWVEGFVSGNFAEREPPVRDDVRDFINGAALEYLDSTTTFAVDGSTWRLAPLPGLVCRLYDAATGTWVSDQMPMAIGPSNALVQRMVGDWFFIGGSVEVYVAWEGTLPSEGDRYRVAVFPRAIGPRNPFHWSGNPVDLATQLFALAGIDYDAASATAVKATLGPLVIHLRITQGDSDTLQAFLEKTVYGPFGFATRRNSAGEEEFFRTRVAGEDETPASVTLDDLYSDEGVAWELEESRAANRVTWESKSFLVNDAAGTVDTSTPIDCIQDASVTIEVDAEDAEGNAVFGEKEVAFRLPGEIAGYYSGTRENPGTLDYFVAALAKPLFDWNGRGSVHGELHVGRWSDAFDAVIGQELTIDLDHVPSASKGSNPTSSRPGAPRRGFILQKTVTPSGATFLVEDRGVSDTLVVVPEFTLAADATYPKTVVEVTITNESALDAAAVTVRVEMAIGPSEPTGAGLFVKSWRPSLDPNPFDLPHACPGSTVWVRMRAEGTGSLVSATATGAVGPWTNWDSLALDDLDPPTGVTWTPWGGPLVNLSWTNNESDYPIEVTYRRTDDTAETTAVVLPPGSTEYTLTLPGLNTDYVVGWRYVPPGPWVCTATMASASILTSETDTLLPPINPAAWADGSGTFGMEVDGQAFPSGTEFWAAAETAVDSGVAGAYELAGETGTTPTRMRFQHPFVAPNDGLLRFLMARHRRGDQVSEFTDPVSVSPWLVVDPVDPVPEPVPDPGVTVTPVPIVMLGAGLVRRFTVIGSDFTRIAVRDKFPLSQFTAMRIAVEVAEGTTVDEGVEVAARFRHPLTGQWVYVDGEDGGGPAMALDQTSLDAADAFGDADGQDDRMVTGDYVTIDDEARDDVQLEVGLRGGDESAVKDVRLTRVELQVVAEEQATAPPPEMPEPPTQNPGECDTPTPIDMDTGWTGGDATGAAWTDGGDQTYTLTIDGSGTGSNAWEQLLTGFEPDALYTFYLTVTTEQPGVRAFLEVDGGDSVECEDAGGETISVQGTASCDGEITLRWGVQDLAGGASSASSDTLQYADQSAAETAGWTFTDTSAWLFGFDTGHEITGSGLSSSMKASVAGLGGASINLFRMQRTFNVGAGAVVSGTLWAEAQAGSSRWAGTALRLENTAGDFTSSPKNDGNDGVEHLATTSTVTAGGDGLITAKIYVDAPSMALPNTFYFAGLELVGAGGGTTVLFTDLGYCPGTGLGDGGTGNGEPSVEDPEGPGNDPEPTEPPGGYPGPPVGGSRPFGIFNISVGGLGYWNSTHNALHPENTVAALNASSTNDCMNLWKFGGERDWLSGGRFSYDRWKAAVDAVYNVARTRAALEAAIAAENRPAWAHFVIDEPFHRRWGGTISLAVLDRMCTYSKQLFPTWPTIVRVSAIDDRLTRAITNCDIYWAEYKLANGDCRAYRDANIAAVEAMSSGSTQRYLILGIHYGAFDRATSGRYITPSEMRQYGGILASSTSDRVLALHGWKWSTAMHTQPGMQEAVRYVRDLFASHDP